MNTRYPTQEALLNALGETVADGINLVRELISHWQSGDLAGAVNALEDWAETQPMKTLGDSNV